MTDKEILEKVILKAQEDGYQLDINYFNRAIDLADDKLYARLFIFSHDFAKAFWGEKKYKEFNPAYCIYRETNLKMWQYHLQQMVLTDEPLKYLEKFL